MNTDAGIRTSRSRSLLLLWIFLAALALRMLWLLQYQSSPFFNNPWLDFTYFDARARDILQGHWFSDAYLFNPLYPLFLALVYPVFGFDLFYPRLIQALMGACSALLVCFIASWTFNRRTGIIAASLTALYLPLIYYDGILMAASLLTFLVLFASALTIKAVSAEKQRTAVCRFLAAGVCFGLVLLGRPNFLLPAVLLAGWAATTHDARASRCSRAAGPIIFFIISLLVISPITIYHRVHHDELVIVAPHGGFNFYIGNHAGATGAYMSIPGISDLPAKQIEDSRKIASEDLQHPVTSAEASRYWMHKSIDFIRSQPGAWLRLLARKIALYWNAAEIPSEYSIDFDSRFHSILRLPLPRFGFIGPLGLTGFLLSIGLLRRRTGHPLLPGLMILGMMTAVVLFFVHARYRMAATPWIIMFAGFCLSELGRMAANRQWKQLVFTGMILTGTIAFSRLPLVERNDLPGFYNLGQAWLKAGNHAEAETCFHYILERDNSMKTWLALGNSQLQTGRPAEAEKSFRNVLAQDPAHFDALMNLGMILSSSGRPEEAETVLRHAFTRYPDRIEPRINLAIVCLEMKKYDDVRTLLDGLSLEGNSRPDIRQAVIQIHRRLELETGGSHEPDGTSELSDGRTTVGGMDENISTTTGETSGQ